MEDLRARLQNYPDFQAIAERKDLFGYEVHFSPLAPIGPMISGRKSLLSMISPYTYRGLLVYALLRTA